MAAFVDAGDGGMAADSSGSDEGDPAFDLMPADAKRKLLKRRRLAAEKASTVKKARLEDALAAAVDDDDDDEEVVITDRVRAADPAAEQPAKTAVCSPTPAEVVEDTFCAQSPSIACRNARMPRDRSVSSEKRLRDAVAEAARLQADKQQRRKRRRPDFDQACTRRELP